MTQQPDALTVADWIAALKDGGGELQPYQRELLATLQALDPRAQIVDAAAAPPRDNVVSLTVNLRDGTPPQDPQ